MSGFGVFPEREEILIGGFGFGSVALKTGLKPRIYFRLNR